MGAVLHRIEAHHNGLIGRDRIGGGLRSGWRELGPIARVDRDEDGNIGAPGEAARRPRAGCHRDGHGCDQRKCEVLLSLAQSLPLPELGFLDLGLVAQRWARRLGASRGGFGGTCEGQEPEGRRHQVPALLPCHPDQQHRQGDNPEPHCDEQGHDGRAVQSGSADLVHDETAVRGLSGGHIGEHPVSPPAAREPAGSDQHSPPIARVDQPVYPTH